MIPATPSKRSPAGASPTPTFVAPRELVVRRLGVADYETTWRAMQEFTTARRDDTADELWLVDHPPVYTLGLAGRPEDRLEDNGIVLVKSDRGGQITYHGPGQVVVYLLLDLTRARLRVRELVTRIEAAVIALLAGQGIVAFRLAGAPGVYVGDATLRAGEVGARESVRKIAALGLRVRRGRSYHGVSLNVDLDLAPFRAINPCGYAGLAVTSLRDEGSTMGTPAAGEALVMQIARQLGHCP